MRIHTLKQLALAACLVGCAPWVMAHDFSCGDLHVDHPYSTPTMGAGHVGAVYFKGIKNNGKDADQLLGATTDVSASVQLHEMSMEGDVMKMRELSSIALPAGADTSFQHGQGHGYHLMLMELKNPLKDGDKFPITLKFQRAGDCKVEVWVQSHMGEHSH